MVAINHMLSGQSVQICPASKNDQTERDSSRQNQDQSLVRDRFTQHQPWKNKVTSTDVNGRECRCGCCGQCVVQSYVQQQEMADHTVKGQPADQKNEKIEQQQAVVSVEKDPTGEPLQPEELVQLKELQKIDQKVRAHEQAHMGAAGGLATSGISLAYVKGPDGQNYAVAGEVSIDTSKASTPRETLAKMMKVRAAALAPADPSPQDRKVAAAASAAMGEARAELQLEQKNDTEQVVEQAGQRKIAEAADREDSPSLAGGSYYRNRYQNGLVNGNDIASVM
jgi:hypothetical protein